MSSYRDQFLSVYYQAEVNRSQSWYLVALLKSLEHVAFDRTLDAQLSIFEFFVPRDMQPLFLSFMQRMEKEGIITNLRSCPNRLANPQEVV